MKTERKRQENPLPWVWGHTHHFSE